MSMKNDCYTLSQSTVVGILMSDGVGVSHKYIVFILQLKKKTVLNTVLKAMFCLNPNLFMYFKCLIEIHLSL